jgi:hypothetical protein
MKYGILLASVFNLALTLGLAPSAGASVFMNEIHYDNAGGDTNEGIEVAGPGGENLLDWSIVLYNGSDGSSYTAFDLGGSIPNQQNGFGTLFFSIPGMQNGPDGMALVDHADSVIQFLSYEGAFLATDGPASGFWSHDIGVTEDSGTLATESLQLFGNGRQYEDFSWGPDPIGHTRGEINTGQSFVPIPGAVWLLGSGLLGLVAVRNRKQ